MDAICDAILEHLTGGATIYTRLRERGGHDIHDALPSPMSSTLAVTPERLAQALERLDRHGFVARTESVHRHDAAEYVVCWRVVPREASARAQAPSATASDG